VKFTLYLVEQTLSRNRVQVHRVFFAEQSGQGFVDFVVLKPRGNSSLTLRIGRYEMAFGSGRMVDLREGPNVPLSFDGFRLSWKSPSWQVDGFGTRPVQNKPGIFDDPPQPDFAFWGFYATHPLSQTQRKALDFYYLGWDRKDAVFNQGAGHEKRHTLGARVWGERGPWAYDAEAMYQFGSTAGAGVARQ
jgi:hypothetical protein